MAELDPGPVLLRSEPDRLARCGHSVTEWVSHAARCLNRAPVARGLLVGVSSRRAVRSPAVGTRRIRRPHAGCTRRRSRSGRHVQANSAEANAIREAAGRFRRCSSRRYPRTRRVLALVAHIGLPVLRGAVIPRRVVLRVVTRVLVAGALGAMGRVRSRFVAQERPRVSAHAPSEASSVEIRAIEASSRDTAQWSTMSSNSRCRRARCLMESNPRGSIRECCHMITRASASRRSGLLTSPLRSGTSLAGPVPIEDPTEDAGFEGVGRRSDAV